MDAKRAEEIERNFEAFQAKVPELLPSKEGKFALMHSEGIEGFFDSLLDAITTGHRSYADGMFSIQQVTAAPMDLGYFSHANPERTLRKG
jgi:hypothetical protein